MKLSVCKVLLVMTIASTLLIGRSRRAEADDPSQSPDLRMLLNLDLFSAAPSNSSAEDAGGGAENSMLDQIRTLSSMGYLHGVAGNQSSPGIVAPSGDEEVPPTDESGSPQL